MREQLETARNRALQLELMLSGAAAREVLAEGTFAEAITDVAGSLATDLNAMLEQYDAAKEGRPIAA